MKPFRGLPLVILILLFSGRTYAAADESMDSRGDMVIIVGSPGSAEYEETFERWTQRLLSAAELGNTHTQVVRPNDEGEGMLPRIQSALAKHTGDSELPLWIVFIGHGTFDGRTAKFAIPGSDLEPPQLAAALESISRPTAVLLCFSASAPFLPELSQPGRILISATNSGNEVSFSYFGDHFSAAIGSPESDLDKDEQTSLLEAFLFASRQTQSFYESTGRLATEHAIIDDNGDGLPVPVEGFDGVRPINRKDGAGLLADGLLAHQWHLIPSAADAALSPEVIAQRNELELRIAELRKFKSDLPEQVYYARLKSLLLEMADLLIEKPTDERPPGVPLPEVIDSRA